MKKLFLLIGLFPLLTLANPDNSPAPHCMHDGKPLPVGESVWVVDPHLVKLTEDAMRKKGYSQEAIKKEVARNDWVGFRLVCVQTFKASAQSEYAQPGDVIAAPGVALVLNEYSDDFYRHVKESATASSPF